MTDETRAREIVNAWLPQPVTAKAATSLAEAIAAALSSARAEGFRAGIERAAQVAELPPVTDTIFDLDACERIAAAIRALPEATREREVGS